MLDAWSLIGSYRDWNWVGIEMKSGWDWIGIGSVIDQRTNKIYVRVNRIYTSMVAQGVLKRNLHKMVYFLCFGFLYSSISIGLEFKYFLVPYPYLFAYPYLYPYLCIHIHTFVSVILLNTHNVSFVSKWMNKRTFFLQHDHYYYQNHKYHKKKNRRREEEKRHHQHYQHHHH